MLFVVQCHIIVHKNVFLASGQRDERSVCKTTSCLYAYTKSSHIYSIMQILAIIAMLSDKQLNNKYNNKYSVYYALSVICIFTTDTSGYDMPNFIKYYLRTRRVSRIQYAQNSRWMASLKFFSFHIDLRWTTQIIFCTIIIRNKKNNMQMFVIDFMLLGIRTSPIGQYIFSMDFSNDLDRMIIIIVGTTTYFSLEISP